MIAQTSLYDQAYYLWSEEMAALLRFRQWDQPDIDNITINNITERIESLNKLWQAFY